MTAATVDDVLAAIESVSNRRGRVLVGISGPPGSGKTHLAHHLRDELLRVRGPDGARVVAMDGYHLPNAELERRGLRARKGAPETFDAEAFLALLGRLRAAGPAAVAAPEFDRTVDEPIPDAIVVEGHVAVVLVEGNYLLLADPPWSHVADQLDLAVYVETPAGVQWSRLVARQGRTHGTRSAAERWIERVDEPNRRIVETTRHAADLVVDGSVSVPGPVRW